MANHDARRQRVCPVSTGQFSDTQKSTEDCSNKETLSHANI